MKKIEINKGLIGMAIVVAVLFIALMLASCSSNKDICRAGSEHKYAKQPKDGIIFNHQGLD